MRRGWPRATDVWDTRGWGADLPGGGTGIHNRNELDLWLQYGPDSGLLLGFRLKTQYSDVGQSAKACNPQSELRVVLGGTILLRPEVGE